MSESVTTYNSTTNESKSKIIFPEISTRSEINNLSFPNDAANPIKREENIFRLNGDFFLYGIFLHPGFLTAMAVKRFLRKEDLPYGFRSA